jgi:hypothetical protein
VSGRFVTGAGGGGVERLARPVEPGEGGGGKAAV